MRHSVRSVGKPAARGKDGSLPPATIVAPAGYFKKTLADGSKLAGELVVSEKGLEIQGEQGFAKKMLRRSPLVLWDQVTGITIDGQTPSTTSLVGSTIHTKSETELVLDTASGPCSYLLPITASDLRNILRPAIAALNAS